MVVSWLGVLNALWACVIFNCDEFMGMNLPFIHGKLRRPPVLESSAKNYLSLSKLPSSISEAQFSPKLSIESSPDNVPLEPWQSGVALPATS